MGSLRKASRVARSMPTLEGAGVRLKRAIGPNEAPEVDPFLLLDDFHSRNPADYVAGFPWHPHRGIETVTYMIRGAVRHGDSIGNSGAINDGDVQWMTAGGGILHQEMPDPYDGMFQGFQLWVNLPASSKMMAPRYRDVLMQHIPTISLAGGVKVKLIAGELDGTKGPVRGLVVPCEYMDVKVPAGAEFSHRTRKDWSAFAYVFEGAADFGFGGGRSLGAEELLIFGEGDKIEVSSGDQGVRFLFASGRPLREPVAWGGPIVMNTKEELELAFEELRRGTFIKTK